MKIINTHIKNIHVKSIVKLRTGLTSADPGTSAWQIKQDWPSSADGVYWIQNASINSGAPFQVYCDMTTLGGGWTLIMQNNYYDWDFSNCLLRNQTSPPTTLATGFSNPAPANYSIIGWADHIKRSASGFDYMLDAGARGTQGGAWTANEAYSFVDQVDAAAYASQGGALYFGGVSGDVVYGSQGFHQNITEIAMFSTSYSDSGIEHRMPWYANNPSAPGSPFVGGAVFTTTHDDSGSWWGTLIDTGYTNWAPAPYQSSGDPGVIWYWVR